MKDLTLCAIILKIFQLSKEVESIWIQGFELDKKLDSMIEKKAKSTAKVISSNFENKQKLIQKSERKKELKSVKTLNDYFNSTNNKDLEDEKEVEANVEYSTDKNSNNFSLGDEDDNEKNQLSIMQSVFRHVFKS